MARPRLLLAIAGTATDVGKTWVAHRLLAAARASGLSVAARKPVQSFDPADGSPTDAEVLAAATGETPSAVCPTDRWYPVPLAPPMAVERLAPERSPLLLNDLLGGCAWPSPALDLGLVETVGGVRSPVAHDADSAQLVAALGPDAVALVADAGLGTINAVRLSVAALASETDAAVHVLLNRFDATEPMHNENLAWLREHDGIDAIAVTGDWPARLLARVRPAGDRPAN